MRKFEHIFTEWFLRISLSFSFLSAVADRFGLWRGRYSIFWGNWDSFERYTRLITSFVPEGFTSYLAYAATTLEIVLGVLLLVPYKTSIVARVSGVLLLSFATSMTLTLGIKTPLDYSVYTASAGAFALGFLTHHRA